MEAIGSGKSMGGEEDGFAVSKSKSSVEVVD